MYDDAIQITNLLRNKSMLMKKKLILVFLLTVYTSLLTADMQAIPVSTIRYDQVAEFSAHSAPATVLSLNDSTISAQINAAIDTIPVKVAEVVSKGQLLVIMDCRTAMAARDASKARYALATYQLERAIKLGKEKHVSEEILRTREAEKVVSQSDLSEKQMDVDHCHLKSPFEGVVVEKIASNGEWVNRGEPLIRLLDLEKLEVSAQIAELVSTDLVNRQGFVFIAGSHKYPLALNRIAANVDASSRTREVRLTFSDKHADPGQSGRLVWQSAGKLLPASYLVKRDSKYGVFILDRDSSKAKFIVVTDAQEGRPFSVELPEETQLIDRGRHTVNDGDSVKVIP